VIAGRKPVRQTALRNPQPTDHPYVVRTEGTCGGRPRIKDSRIPVSVIAGFVRDGASLDEITAFYTHVEPVAIEDAISYYRDHREEIDAEIEAGSLESVLEETGAVLEADGAIRFTKKPR
jgi:uncharacterized protein (DUF433 family)